MQSFMKTFEVENLLLLFIVQFFLFLPSTKVDICVTKMDQAFPDLFVYTVTDKKQTVGRPGDIISY